MAVCRLCATAVCVLECCCSLSQVKRIKRQESKASDIKESDTALHENFMLEVAFAAYLTGPRYVSQFLGAASLNEGKALVFDLYEQGSLKKVLLTDKKFSGPGDLPKVVDMLMDACAGLYHLHQNHVIHRDVATRNFLLDGDRVRICDFGLAAYVPPEQNNTGTGWKFGPIPWMAPEALREGIFSEQTDVYMFGIMLVEVFSRSAPYSPQFRRKIGGLKGLRQQVRNLHSSNR